MGGALTNTGSVTIGNSSLSKAATVTAAGLANTGTINLAGGTAARATLDSTTAAPATWTGSIFLSGDALLEFASGKITAIGSGGEISRSGPSTLVAVSTALTGNSALNGITSNAGTFVFSNGAGLSTPGLTNTGTLYVDASGSGGSSLTIGGTLTNMGYVDVGNSGITAAATLTVTGLANSGTIYLTSGTAAAVLKDTGAFGNTDFVGIDAFSGGGGSALTISGTLTNSSTFEVGNGNLIKATTVTAAGLSNTGTIALTGGTATQAALDITASAPATWTGTAELTGDALLEFTGTTGITAIGTSC